MKRKSGNYIQLSRDLFNSPVFLGMTVNAKWVYTVLNELEHRFTGTEKDYFYRSNEDLAYDAGISVSSVKRAKRELKGVVEMWQGSIPDFETGQPSNRTVTFYRIINNSSTKNILWPGSFI